MAKPTNSQKKTERNRMLFRLAICAAVLLMAAALHSRTRRTAERPNGAEAVFAEIGHRLGKSVEDERTGETVAVAQTHAWVTESAETKMGNDDSSVAGNRLEP